MQGTCSYCHKPAHVRRRKVYGAWWRLCPACYQRHWRSGDVRYQRVPVLLRSAKPRRLLEDMLTAGLPQTEIAKKLRVSQSTVSRTAHRLRPVMPPEAG